MSLQFTCTLSSSHNAAALLALLCSGLLAWDTSCSECCPQGAPVNLTHRTAKNSLLSISGLGQDHCVLHSTLSFINSRLLTTSTALLLFYYCHLICQKLLERRQIHTKVLLGMGQNESLHKRRYQTICEEPSGLGTKGKVSDSISV